MKIRKKVPKVARKSGKNGRICRNHTGKITKMAGKI